LSEQRPAIDLTRTHFVRHLGDLSIYGTWIFNNDQEAEEPALVVIPRYRRDGFKPCVVALSAAYKYNDERYMVRAARHFLSMLGIQDSMAECHKVATLIHSHLLDLLTIPPSPTTAIIVGEAVIGEGLRRRTVDILDYEPTQQA
jgi:hypothetical protein